MADELLKKAQDLFEGQIVSSCIYVFAADRIQSALNYYLQDFEGQRVAELITTMLLSFTGVGQILL